MIRESGLGVSDWYQTLHTVFNRQKELLIRRRIFITAKNSWFQVNSMSKSRVLISCATHNRDLFIQKNEFFFWVEWTLAKLLDVQTKLHVKFGKDPQFWPFLVELDTTKLRNVTLQVELFVKISKIRSLFWTKFGQP